MSYSVDSETNRTAAPAGKRARTTHVPKNAMGSESFKIGNFVPDLGLMPTVAELVNGYLDSQGRLVYIVETGKVPNPDDVHFEDRPTKFPSTIVGVFSTEAAARACMRKVMAENIWMYDGERGGKMTAATFPWGDFYCCGGTSPEKESAIQSLRDGHEGAEEKFDFPWSEVSDSERVFYTCCDTFLVTDARRDRRRRGKRSNKSWQCKWHFNTYYERPVDCDWGHTFIIRTSLVK